MKTVMRMFVLIGAMLCCACALSSCVKEDTGDCPVPHHFDYDWRNLVEEEGYLGQNHLRLYDGSGACDPHDCPQEGILLYLKQRHYRVVTYNDRLQGITYSGLETAETARATVEEVPTPGIVALVEEMRTGGTPGETLIGQAEGFLYRASIPDVTVDFRYEGHSLLVPEPVGYEIAFRSTIKDWEMSDAKSLELALSGVVSEVFLSSGGRTEAPVRTALTGTTRGEDCYLSSIYVLGLDREQVVLKGYLEPSAGEWGPVYIERDITDIVSEAIAEAEQTGNPRIEFELVLVPTEVAQEPG